MVLPAAVVQIEHGRHRVHPQAIHVILLQPVDGVGDQEGLHLTLAEVKNTGGPVGMLVHHRVGKLIAAGAVELVQAVLILGEMGRHPVQQHADVRLVAAIHKFHELLRRTVAVCRSIIARHLVAPGGFIGVFRQGHQLHMGIAHLPEVRDQLVSQLLIVVATAVRLAFPGAEVHFIDVDGAVEDFSLALAAAEVAVAPDIAVKVADHAGILRQSLGTEAIGIGLVDFGAVGPADTIFVGLPLPGILGKGLPDAVFQSGHGQIVLIPKVPVAGHGDFTGIGGPDAEYIALYTVLFCRVAAHKGVGAEFVAVREALERILQDCVHLCLLCSIRRNILIQLDYTTLHKKSNCFEEKLIKLLYFPLRLINFRLW